MSWGNVTKTSKNICITVENTNRVRSGDLACLYVDLLKPKVVIWTLFAVSWGT